MMMLRTVARAVPRSFAKLRPSVVAQNLSGSSIGAFVLPRNGIPSARSMSAAASSSGLPYAGVRIIESGSLLSGRLTARLFADQGAEVIILADHDNKNVAEFNDETNSYLDRGKTKMGSLSAEERADLLGSADVVIVDGECTEYERTGKQVLLRVCAALPGDEKYGHLPHDIDDDYLSAITGFYTDMALSHFLDRKVVYTPLRLCSVYAAVNGAVATGAALVDRQRTNLGRELLVSRLANGIAAIGALSLTIDGPNLPSHLISTPISHIRQGADPDEFEAIRKEATKDPAKQLWLERRLYPLASPYECSDGSLFLPMATFNRGIARRLVEHLGVWPKLQEMGIVDLSAYDAANNSERFNNLALPLNFSWQSGCAIADEFEKIFKQKTAKEWERECCEAKMACADVISFKEWFADDETRRAKIVADVEGEWQIGRSAWCQSAKPYPDLKQGTQVDGAAASEMVEQLLESQRMPEVALPGGHTGATGQFLHPAMVNAQKPLKGYTVVDFSNVIAGPACGRMLAELGATVYKVGPALPDHAPVVMVTWQAEEMIGKESIMLDLKTEDGQEAMKRLLSKADIALANKHDKQLESIGIGRDQLDSMTENGALGPKLIQLQVAARRGEQAEGVDATNWPGYDPALQGKTGLMERFGPPGCPTYHGVASCVDYLCGYTGAFAGVTALYARETHGAVSERAGTSLAACATLVQCTMQGEEPDARGPWARGRSPLNRVYQVGFPETPENAAPEHWIYAQADRDLSSEAMNFDGSRDDFIAKLSEEGILATPVHSCKQVAAVSKTNESKTLRFEKRESEGLLTETWKPTWFCFDGIPSSCPGGAAPSGVHAPKILMDVCGYTEAEVCDMYDKEVVLPIYWDKQNTAKEAHIWSGAEEGQSAQRRKMDPASFKYDDPKFGNAM